MSIDKFYKLFILYTFLILKAISIPLPFLEEYNLLEEIKGSDYKTPFYNFLQNLAYSNHIRSTVI